MGNPCNCTNSLKNLGVSSCKDLRNVIRRAIFVPEYNLAGTKNEIANVAGVTLAALIAKYDAAAIENRFFPLPICENIENVRADDVFQEFNSGTKAKVKEGTKSITFFIPVSEGASPRLYENMKATLECQKGGFYFVDRNGNFIYITDKTTELKVQPILYEQGSMSVTLVEPTESEVQMIKVSFDIRFSMNDGLLRHIEAESLDFDALVDPYSLLDVNSAISAISQTGFTATLTTDYGLPVKGLVKDDFALYNITGTASIVITSVTESSDGVYVFVIPSQTIGHVLRLTPTKARYDFANTVATTITVA